MITEITFVCANDMFCHVTAVPVAEHPGRFTLNMNILNAQGEVQVSDENVSRSAKGDLPGVPGAHLGLAMIQIQTEVLKDTRKIAMLDALQALMDQSDLAQTDAESRS